MYDSKGIAEIFRAQAAYEVKVQEILAGAGASPSTTQSGLPPK